VVVAAQLCIHCPSFQFADPDPHHFGKVDPDPDQSGKLDPDPYQSKKVEALEDHFGTEEGRNLGGKIRIRVSIKLKSRIWKVSGSTSK
jgi:hypothetical protein